MAMDTPRRCRSEAGKTLGLIHNWRPGTKPVWLSSRSHMVLLTVDHVPNMMILDSTARH